MEEIKQTIDERILKITGSSTIPEGLELDGDYILGLGVNCYGKHQESNQDNTSNLIYKCRMTGEVVIQTKLGKQIKGKARSSKSRVFRFKVEELGLDYEKIMDKMISHAETVLDFVNTLK